MQQQKKQLQTRNRLAAFNSSLCMKGIHVIKTGVFGVNSLIVPLEGKKCFVVDPATCAISRDEKAVVSYLHDKKLECTGIVLTHSHFDHITGIAEVKKAFPNALVLIHKNEYAEIQNPPGAMTVAVLKFFDCTQLLPIVVGQPSAEIPLEDGQTLSCIGADKWRVIHTPGHTPGSICLYNKENKLLITGDTLFDCGGRGRTDMYGGDTAEIIRSISMLRKIIPAGTTVYPGHENFGFSF